MRRGRAQLFYLADLRTAISSSTLVVCIQKAIVQGIVDLFGAA
ncbi:hypothetical protein [Bradyrhizobium genosp. P]